MSCNSTTATPNLVYAATGEPPAACGSGVLQNPNAALSGRLLVKLRKIALTYSDSIQSGQIRFPSNDAYVQFKKGQLLAAGKKGIRPQQSIIMTELQQFGCCQKAATVNAGGLNKYVPYTQP